MGALSGRSIYLVGDSWVAGAAGRALATELRRQGARVQVDGKVGRTSRALSRDVAFPRALRTFRPSLIIYMLGVNDTPGAQLRGNYERLAAAARGADVWVVPNTMLNHHVERINAVTLAQREVFGERVVNTRGLTTAEDYDGSGYHLHRAGAERWVARLVQRLPITPLDTLGQALLQLVPGATR